MSSSSFPDGAPDASVSPAPREQGRRFPPKSVLAAAIVLVVLAVWLRFPEAFGGALEEGFFRAARIFDHQLANIFTLICGFLAVMTLLVWFVFFSAYGRRLRMMTLVGTIAALVILVGLVRYDEVNGELIPRFVWRWTPAHDRTLNRPVAEAASGIDLSNTTPDDFPGFLGPDRSAYLAGPKLSKEWPAGGPKQLWQQPIGAGWSGFAVVNGYAVTLEQRGDEEFVTCYDVKNGMLKWSHANAGRHYHPLGGVGPRSTPTIDEGRVYALTATGMFFCLDGANGAVVWQKNLLEEIGSTPQQETEAIMWGRAASPLVVDDLVVIPAGGPSADKAESLIAYDKRTGDVRWRGGQRQISYASPSLATISGVRQIVTVNEDTVTGTDIESGKELWVFSFPGHSNADGSASQAVAVSDDRVFVSKGYYGGGTLYQVTKDDQGQWSTKRIWEDPRKMKTKFTNVVVKDGFIYGLSDGILECLAVEDGARQWKKGRYGHGQMLGVGDLLLILAETGEVALCELNPSQHVELARFQAIEGKTWNTIALYGSLLILRNAEEAACYELPLANWRQQSRASLPSRERQATSYLTFCSSSQFSSTMCSTIGARNIAVREGSSAPSQGRVTARDIARNPMLLSERPVSCARTLSLSRLNVARTKFGSGPTWITVLMP
jgi:outer membrane protein assembly factor BamB